MEDRLHSIWLIYLYMILIRQEMVAMAFYIEGIRLFLKIRRALLFLSLLL